MENQTKGNEMKDYSSYDDRHGGPFDRGVCDSYYHRPRKPHYYVEDTYSSDCVSESGMTPEELEAYNAGYEYNETVLCMFKEYI
jgi:hypothetical protein